MDPFTFGITFVGATGGGLLVLTALEKAGLPINETAMKVVMECVKLGGILYFLDYVKDIFFW
ncbi:hypothetical protein [Bacillus sp. 7894-2]|uniref:hypothetical protein n=1 Tax=Bacillus sp. 7894-2 TaxID=2021695 RepID=UPI000BA7C107|nr:hypothetical protein [Bacillus sp. 7894-2]PAE24086.1 hypothetical protein CHI10_14895 [Bacillus sp. 7894-2]